MPCFNGDKHEAKFGSIGEEINYTIQDYFQAGVTPLELKEWIDKLLKEVEQGQEGAKERFQMAFPKRKLEEHKNYQFDELVAEVKLSPEAISYFLKLRLDKLMMSGSVISMAPQDVVGMGRAVGGVSATLGAKDSLHKQFTVNKEMAGRIQAEMIYRLIKRVNGHQTLLEYDPQHPQGVLDQANKQAPLCAVIDGAGAYREFDPKQMAASMRQANSKLQRVGFHSEGGNIDFTGDPDAELNDRGFYFSQPNTRGADVRLKADGTALLTVNDQGTMEDLNQQEGRMRLPGQKVLIARSKFAPEIKTLGDVVQRKSAYEARKMSEDLFRAKKQELNTIQRTYSKKHLLSIDSFNTFLDQFKEFQSVLISPSSPNYEEPGSYFEKNKHIRKCNHKPMEVFTDLRMQLIDSCKKFGLGEAVKELESIQYTEEILKAMPENVYSLKDHIETELEVELEEELELEREQEMYLEEEMEFELEKERETVKQMGVDVPFYLPRLETSVVYHVQEKIHPAYHPKLQFTDSFLPLSRKDPMYRRKAFDDKMYRVGSVFVEFNSYNRELKTITIGDVLDDIKPDPYKSGFYYDIRTGKITAVTKAQDPGLSSAFCEKVLQSREVVEMIAQIKFFDGQINGYTERELEELAAWLQKSHPKVMRKHFEEEILKYRNEVFERYPHSQLWKLFEAL